MNLMTNENPAYEELIDENTVIQGELIRQLCDKEIDASEFERKQKLQSNTFKRKVGEILNPQGNTIL